MAHNTIALLTDVNGKPIPQYYDPAMDSFQPMTNRISIQDSFAVIKSAPVTGAKTVSTTAAEVFAGANRLINRYLLKISKERTIPIYEGGSGITTARGDPAVLNFSPSVAVRIYARAEASVSIRMVELV